MPRPETYKDEEEGPEIPEPLLTALRDRTVVIAADHGNKLADGRTLAEHLAAWQNAPSNTMSAPPDCKPADEEETDRWPVVTIYANGNLADRSVFDDVNYVDPPEQTYHPESAPNVLSPEEARMLVHLAKVHGISFSGADLRALIECLKDYADSQKEKP